MFSTLLGALPPDPERAAAPAANLIRSTLGDLEAAGLELLSNGEPLDLAAPPTPEAVVDSRRLAADGATRPVKAVLPGPYSASRAGDRSAAAWAEALQPAIDALAEPAVRSSRSMSPMPWRLPSSRPSNVEFVDAHRRLTNGIAGVHRPSR